MLKLFAPNYYIENYKKLDLNKLKENNIKLLICDIDNTLVPHDQVDMDDDVIKFLDQVYRAGIETVLISNNTKERVEIFTQNHSVPTYAFARKPLKKTYKAMMTNYDYSPKEIAAFGDQLLTDILGGNRMGFYTILTKQLAPRDLSFTKINRLFEKLIYFLLRKSKLLTKGEYDE